MGEIEIFVIDKDGERTKIDDLYWFEENGVHDFGGEGHYYEPYLFEIYIDGKPVFKTESE